MYPNRRRACLVVFIYTIVYLSKKNFNFNFDFSLELSIILQFPNHQTVKVLRKKHTHNFGQVLPSSAQANQPIPPPKPELTTSLELLHQNYFAITTTRYLLVHKFSQFLPSSVQFNPSWTKIALLSLYLSSPIPTRPVKYVLVQLKFDTDTHQTNLINIYKLAFTNQHNLISLTYLT